MRALAQPRSLARRPVRALLAQWPLALADEVEGIHQARVASRRLRELVPAVARAADAREARALRRGFRQVTRLLGRSRELDVALDTLLAIDARAPAHAVAVTAVRASVLLARAEAARDARDRLASLDVNGLAVRTLALTGRSASRADVLACARRVAARLGRRAAELQNAVVGAGLIFAPGPLHGVRIALKKFRYALEVAERLGRFRLSGSMRRLKGLQNLLGELHDLQVLGGLARDVMSQAPAPRRAGLDRLVTSIDDDIRALHSRFVSERERLVPLLARSAGVRKTLVGLPPPEPPASPPGGAHTHPESDSGGPLMALHVIYLVRHGLAAEQGPEFPNDDDRPLTSEGIERLRVQVLGLRALDVRLDRVLTSPLVRAAQTAEILAAGVGCAVPPVPVDALRPGGRYDAAAGRDGADRPRPVGGAGRPHAVDWRDRRQDHRGPGAAGVQEGRGLLRRNRDAASVGRRSAEVVRPATGAARARPLTGPPGLVPRRWSRRGPRRPSAR